MTPNSFVKTMQSWNEIFFRLSMRNLFRFSKETGYSISQLGALFRISKNPIGVSDLGRNLGITPAAASQMLEKLFQQKLILRTEDPRDRRAKRIVLTEKGKQVLEDSMKARESWLMDLDTRLSASEKEHIASILEVLIKDTLQSTDHSGLNQ